MRVGDMRAIPSQQILDAVDRCNSDMVSVHLGLGRQGATLDERFAERSNFLGRLQLHDTLQRGKTTLRGFGVTETGLGDDKLGNNQIELGTLRLPPFDRRALVGHRSKIVARTRRQVTNDRRFDIYLGFQ